MAVICAGLLSACGSSSGSSASTSARKIKVNVAHVERAIRRSILSQRHLKSTVVCPSTVRQTAGKFPCIAKTFSRKKPYEEIETPFVVTVHDNGSVTYVGEGNFRR